MKNLKKYQNQYLAAKTAKGKKSAYNRAMLNLSFEDKKAFSKWQVEKMNNETF